MSEEYSGNIISISDEDGNNYELEHLDTIEMDGTKSHLCQSKNFP